MHNQVIVSWQAQEAEYRPKQPSWYWAIGIASGGIAIGAVIAGNYLFAAIAILAGFTIMLVGSRRPMRHTYKLTEHGFMIGTHLIPYEKMVRFAIHEDDPIRLIIETTTISGTISAPLGSADWRTIRMELKNQNIEEVESLDSFIEKVERALGL